MTSPQGNTLARDTAKFNDLPHLPKLLTPELPQNDHKNNSLHLRNSIFLTSARVTTCLFLVYKNITCSPGIKFMISGLKYMTV